MFVFAVLCLSGLLCLRITMIFRCCALIFVYLLVCLPAFFWLSAVFAYVCYYFNLMSLFVCCSITLFDRFVVYLLVCVRGLLLFALFVLIFCFFIC